MQSMKVNITPDKTAAVIKFSQNDNGRQVRIYLHDEQGEYLPPFNATVDIRGTKPSGLGFEKPCEVDEYGVLVTCNSTMTAECGRFPVELRISSSGKVIGTANFEMWVERSPHPDGTINGNAPDYVPVFTALVNRAETAATSAEEASAIAVAAVQNSAYGFFHIDDTDGHLYLQKTETFDNYARFLIDRNGHLNVTIGGN